MGSRRMEAAAMCRRVRNSRIEDKSSQGRKAVAAKAGCSTVPSEAARSMAGYSTVQIGFDLPKVMVEGCSKAPLEAARSMAFVVGCSTVPIGLERSKMADSRIQSFGSIAMVWVAVAARELEGSAASIGPVVSTGFGRTRTG